MRHSTSRDKAIQLALVLILLAPLLAAFWGAGGFDDAFGSPKSPAEAAARRWILLGDLGRSLLVGGLSTFIAAVIGIPAAWALARRRVSVFRSALMILPFALPTPVAVSGWVQLIAPSATSSFALQLPGTESFASRAHTLLFSPIGAACVLGFSLWPVVALNAWPGFRRARDESYESALLSATPARAFLQTVLPRCWGHVAAGIALVFLLASNDFGVCSLLLVKTLPVEVHDQATLGKNSAAAWASLPLVAMAALLCALPVLRVRTNGNVPSTPQTIPAANATSSGWFCTSMWTGGVLLGLAIPMLACLRGVLNSGKPPSAAFDAGAESMLLSARLAAAAVLIGSALAIVRVLVWPDRSAGMLVSAGVFLLAVPGTFLAAALLTLQIKTQNLETGFLERFVYPPQVWLACGFALRFLFIPLRMAEEAVASINPAILESAAVLGQGRFARAISVALPLSLGHLAAAAALTFTLVLGEVPIAATLAPPGAVPATIWLFNQQHMGYDESVFALSLLLGMVSAGAVAIGALGARLASR